MSPTISATRVRRQASATVVVPNNGADGVSASRSPTTCSRSTADTSSWTLDGQTRSIRRPTRTPNSIDILPYKGGPRNGTKHRPGRTRSGTVTPVSGCKRLYYTNAPWARWCASTMSAARRRGVPLRDMGCPAIANGPESNEGGPVTSPSPTSWAPRTRFGDMDLQGGRPTTENHHRAPAGHQAGTGFPAGRARRGAAPGRRGARLTILEVMREAIDAPGEMSPQAPPDHHDQGPGGQDRRGHRAQGQDDQLDPRRTPAPRSRIEDVRHPSTSVPPTAPPPRPRGRRSTLIANPHMPEVGERFLGNRGQGPPRSARSFSLAAGQGRACSTSPSCASLHGGGPHRQRRWTW